MKLISEVKDAKKIAIGGHVRPDGDCVCSVMALYRYLQKELPEAQIDIYLEKPSEVFRCIQGMEEIHSDFQTEEKYDVFVALDCNDERLGEALPIFRRAGRRINIDHHISNTGCGDLNIIEPQKSSTAELLYELMEQDAVDEEIAKAIYIGMAHDTGVFRYSNTSPRTLEIAAKLLGFGFDFSALLEHTFFERTYVQTQIMGRAVLESVRFMNDRCIVSMVSRRMMEFYQVGPKDLDGIVNHLQVGSGVDCAIFMYEIGTLQYKVSMRSNGKVNVAQVAVQFGGGGHLRAAGCTMNGTYHDNINNLSKEIAGQLKKEQA